jgi:hypothetical protein
MGKILFLHLAQNVLSKLGCKKPYDNLNTGKQYKPHGMGLLELKWA